MMNLRYEIRETAYNGPWMEVSQQVWQWFERYAGFNAPDGQDATMGFTGAGINGRVRPATEKVDFWKDLLKKYMNHVANEEGITFVPYGHVENHARTGDQTFTHEELAALQAIKAELENETENK